MKNLKNLLVRFVREDQGQDLIEYAFLAVFLAQAVTVTLGCLGTSLNTKMGEVNTAVSQASPGSGS